MDCNMQNTRAELKRTYGENTFGLISASQLQPRISTQSLQSPQLLSKVPCGTTEPAWATTQRLLAVQEAADKSTVARKQAQQGVHDANTQMRHALGLERMAEALRGNPDSEEAEELVAAAANANLDLEAGESPGIVAGALDDASWCCGYEDAHCMCMCK